MTDLHIEAVAAMERAKGFAHVRRINDQWRREVGMPRRQVEASTEVSVQLRASFAGFKEQMDKVAAVFNPGAPDGRNSWEDEPAPIYDQLQRERGAA